MPALTSPCTKKGGDIFSWQDVKSVYKTDDELAFLYSIGESKRMAGKNDAVLKLDNKEVENYVVETTRYENVESGESCRESDGPQSLSQ
jgi:hypothetical protein